MEVQDLPTAQHPHFPAEAPFRVKRPVDGYMSDSSNLRYQCWAMHTDNANTLSTTQEHDDYEENDQGQGDSQGEASRQRAAHPVPWRDLESSCRKLDAAQIRISSIDLSCMEEDADDVPLDLFEADEDTQEDSAPETAYTYRLAHGQGHAPLGSGTHGPASAVVPRLRTPPMAGSRGQEPKGSGPVQPAACLGESLSPPQSSTGSGILSAVSSTSSGAASTKGSGVMPASGSLGSPAPYNGPRPVTAGGGDILQAPHQVPHISFLGAPERSVSGMWGSPAKGSPAKAAAAHGGPAAPVAAPPLPAAEAAVPVTMCRAGAVSLEERLKEIRFVPEEERPRHSSSIRYSSLVLPGAVSRDARVVGVRKYINAVKMRCGELFTTTKRGKS